MNKSNVVRMLVFFCIVFNFFILYCSNIPYIYHMEELSDKVYVDNILSKNKIENNICLFNVISNENVIQNKEYNSSVTGYLAYVKGNTKLITGEDFYVYNNSLIIPKKEAMNLFGTDRVVGLNLVVNNKVYSISGVSNNSKYFLVNDVNYNDYKFIILGKRMNINTISNTYTIVPYNLILYLITLINIVLLLLILINTLQISKNIKKVSFFILVFGSIFLFIQNFIKQYNIFLPMSMSDFYGWKTIISQFINDSDSLSNIFIPVLKGRFHICVFLEISSVICVLLYSIIFENKKMVYKYFLK